MKCEHYLKSFTKQNIYIVQAYLTLTTIYGFFPPHHVSYRSMQLKWNKNHLGSSMSVVFHRDENEANLFRDLMKQNWLLCCTACFVLRFSWSRWVKKKEMKNYGLALETWQKSDAVKSRLKASLKITFWFTVQQQSGWHFLGREAALNLCMRCHYTKEPVCTIQVSRWGWMNRHHNDAMWFRG